MEASLGNQGSVFTVQELAEYLRMKPLTIYKHVASGKLPGFKVGSHWRFKKETIETWISAQEKSSLNQNTLIIDQPKLV